MTKRKIIILTSILIGLVILAIAFWLGVSDGYFSKDKEQVVSIEDEQSVAETGENEEDVVEKEIDAPEWKIYRNEEHGFEVKYPSYWGEFATELPLHDEDEMNFFKKTQVKAFGKYGNILWIFAYSKIDTEKHFTKSVDTLVFEKNINNVNYHMQHNTSPELFEVRDMVFFEDGEGDNYILLTLSTKKKDKIDIHEDIISSFKFID